MILIDKRNETQRVILTLNGFDFDPVLLIQNDENRSKHSLNLPENTSASPTRYDEFILDTVDFDEIPTGYYSYQILSGSQTIECGKMKVIDDKVVAEILSAPDTQSILIFK